MGIGVNITVTDSGVLGRRLNDRARRIAQAERQIAARAAQTATEVTRQSFRYKRPSNVPKRKGRTSTGGKMRESLQWKVGPHGEVAFDVDKANQEAPHWLIQEIGTGNSAVVRRGGSANPRGRPWTGASYVRTVRSQVGRRISPRLAWGSGPRGTYFGPGDASGQQLYLRARLRKKPRKRTGMTITKEIEGQHFVQQGGQAGFAQYRQELLAKARLEFADMTYRKRMGL